MKECIRGKIRWQYTGKIVSYWNEERCWDLLRGRRKCIRKGAQSSLGHNPQLNKSFVCRFWPKRILSRGIYPKGNVDVPATAVCPFGCPTNSVHYHCHKRGKTVARRDEVPFCCLSCSVLSFFVLSVKNHLAGSSDHFRITSREEALSLHPLQLCSSLPFTVRVVCCFSHRGPEVLQALVPLQRRQQTARRVCWKKHHDEKGAKAHSTWSTIRTNKLQTFYDKLNLSARYPAARMDGRSLVCFFVSRLVIFCHSETYSRWPTFSPRNSADQVPREWESSNTDQFHQTGNWFLLVMLVFWWKQKSGLCTEMGTTSGQNPRV